MLRTAFQTTSSGRLDKRHPVFRLWQKSKQLGIWDPRDIDMARDRQDWVALTDPERDILLRLIALFQGGEEAVTLDLLPLIQVIAAEGRLEEEIYLTSFLWEEAKHVEAFDRFLTEVAQADADLSHYHTPSYRTIFYDMLPAALGRLRHDASPEAQVEASVTYNLIVEGVLAETGYHASYTVMRRRGILPGMLQVVDNLKRDESRHLAYGVFLLSRLVAEHGEPAWQAIQRRMNELIVPATGMIEELFSYYDRPAPFELDVNEFVGYAMAQFQRRLARIDRARSQSLAEVLSDGDLDELMTV
ncbi:MAG: R2-like ligand-binding oxidase [Pirellulales bacterium]|nr:R2-like ligand-binding oxidase [Pirellulales bacterium]